MEDRVQFISEFRTASRRKGTTPEDLFFDYDAGKTGMIKIEAFQRIISSIGFWVSEGRLAHLTAPFIKGNDFKYTDFMSTSSSSATINNKNTATDEDVIAFGRQLASRSIYLTDTLEEIDRHHFGHVSETDFLRTFGSNKLTQMICARFKNSLNEVEYLKLGNEIKRLQKENFSSTLSGSTSTKGGQKQLNLPPFFGQVATDINSQGIDLCNTFLGLDKFKRGQLQKKVFSNALYSFNLHINAKQLCELVDAFSDDENQVKYQTFCDEVQKVIESIPPPTKSTFTIKGDINVTLQYLRDVEKNRHSQLAENLKKLDPQDSGIIQSLRFFKALNIEKYKLSQEDVDVIEQNYSDGQGNIRYQNLLSDISPPTARNGPSAKQVIERLRNFLANRQLQLKPKLIRYDTDRSGKIVIRDLFNALHSISFDFTQKEWNQLSSYLGQLPTSYFQYGPFCESIDPVIPEDTWKPPVVEIQKERKVQTHSKPPENIINILLALYQAAKKVDIGIYEEFRAHDTLRQGTVPTSQFQSFIIKVNPSLSRQEVVLLSNHYKDLPMTTNYANMCEDLTNYVESIAQNSQKTVNATPSEPCEDTLNLLRRLKSILDIQRIAPEELFIRYDTAYSGFVLKTRIGAILQSTNVNATKEEQQSLEKDFQDDRRQELINYKRICTIIGNLKLSQKDLSSIRVTSQTVNVPEREVAVLVNSLRERIQERHKRVRDPFSHLQQGTPASTREFREAINSFGLIIKEVDLLKLLKFYRVNRQGDVDWETFCHDVETSKTVEMV